MPAHPFQKPFCAALVIPTGIGASVGGYGGDAMPVLNLLASVCDVLVTHPNVANAAMFQSLPDNALYVEGYALDRWFRGDWQLLPQRANRVAIVYDSGIEPDMLTLHRNTANAVQAVYGVSIIGEFFTAEPVRLTLNRHGEAGASTGALENPECILAACHAAKSAGADAIALCVRFPDDEDSDYQSGSGVDPIGGLEAILSHLIVSELEIPCAHAPVFSRESAEPEWRDVVDPRAASEYITGTFLPCVLTGLHKAPRYAPAQQVSPYAMSIDHLDALVLPGDVLGGIPALAAMERGIPIIAVMNNITVMTIGPDAWPQYADKIHTVQNYLEAAGLLQAMRLGLTTQVFKPKN
jgi:hypothetical protein